MSDNITEPDTHNYLNRYRFEKSPNFQKLIYFGQIKSDIFYSTDMTHGLCLDNLIVYAYVIKVPID